MALAAANRPSISSDPRERLRASKQAEKQKRDKPASSLGNVPGISHVRAAMLAMSMLNATPQVPKDDAPTDSSPTTQSYSRDEIYSRAFRAAQVKRQAGELVGLDLNHRASSDESRELEDIQQEEAAKDEEFLMRNQLGQDKRLSSAKRAQLESMASKSLDKGLKFLGEKAAKELSALGINSIEDLLEVLDDGEDLFVFQIVNGVLSAGKGVRAIFPGKLASDDDPKTLKEAVAKNAMTLFDVIFPPVGISSGSKITGMLGLLAYGLIFSFILLVLGFVILIIYGMVSFTQNPLSTLLQVYQVTGLSGVATVLEAAGNAAINSANQYMTQ